jgi:hypothetical protein
VKKGSQVYVETSLEIKEADPEADPTTPRGQKQIFLRHRKHIINLCTITQFLIPSQSLSECFSAAKQLNRRRATSPCLPTALIIQLGSEHVHVDTQSMAQILFFRLLRFLDEMAILFEHIHLGLGDVVASPICFISYYNINLLLVSNYRAFASRRSWRRLFWKIGCECHAISSHFGKVIANCRGYKLFLFQH